jgi:hypothetical protein
LKKTETPPELDLNEEEQEYEDWQYEMSTQCASEFIEDELIPVLDTFDYENENSDYIPGVATYILFTRIVEVLIEQGFTDAELKAQVDNISDVKSYRVVH